MAHPMVFAYGTLFGNDKDPLDPRAPGFDHVPLSNATAIELDDSHLQPYLVARNVFRKIEFETKINIHLTLPYDAGNDGRAYPAQDIVLDYWLRRVKSSIVAAGSLSGSINGIVIDELLVPVAHNLGIQNKASELVRKFRSLLDSDASIPKGLELSAWFLNPDTVRLKEPAGVEFINELFTTCTFVLAEMHQLEFPAKLFDSVDYIRTVVRQWIDLGVAPELVRSKAIISLPLPKFQLSEHYPTHAENYAFLLDLIRWYGRPDADPSDGIPAIRDLTAGVSIYLENEFNSTELASINMVIGETLLGQPRRTFL